ncbi:heterokaryon incompatibility protein-domain-containing protein [Trametes elegans]|nr:heterokaryon incompatibility protein-domain-containing protein [Trametes elegans]
MSRPFTVSDVLEACEGTPGADAANDKPLRVLLRNTENIYEVVPFSGQPYIAISYCWPPQNSSFQRLSSSNETTPVLTANGLLHSKHFSQFIAQAAHSYDPSLAIWIDYHCINQVDPDEKTAQVAIMQRIYTGARLTLIILEDGYLSPEERLLMAKPLASPEGMSVIRRILTARWFTRAWCSQELVLSHHAHFCIHDTSNPGSGIIFAADTLWHTIDALRNRDPTIPPLPQSRGHLPDTAMAWSTCAWAMGIVLGLGCYDDYDKVALLCNLVRFIYRFSRRPSAPGNDSDVIRLNVLKMANVIALKRRDFSLLLTNHAVYRNRPDSVRSCRGFGWAGEPIDGDRPSAVWVKKDFQVTSDPDITLDEVGLLARGCVARVVREFTWKIHRDVTGLHLTVDGYTRVVFGAGRPHESWTWSRDRQHLHDLLVSLAAVDGHQCEEASLHARVIFAYLLEVDYISQPSPIPGNLRRLARSFLDDLCTLKDIAAAMGFIWRRPSLAVFSTVLLDDGNVLLVSGNAPDVSPGRLLFQPYVVRPKLFSPPAVLTVNSMVLENRLLATESYRCTGCVRGLGMISDAAAHGTRRFRIV